MFADLADVVTDEYENRCHRFACNNSKDRNYHENKSKTFVSARGAVACRV